MAGATRTLPRVMEQRRLADPRLPPHKQRTAPVVQAIQDRIDALALGLAPDQLQTRIAPGAPGHDLSISLRPRGRSATTRRRPFRRS
jgi:hypothetical protein